MPPNQPRPPSETADAPRCELMKCPECGHDSFQMGKTVHSDEIRCWRVSDRLGAALHAEKIDIGGDDDLHIICRKCGTQFGDGEIEEMWEVGGWRD